MTSIGGYTFTYCSGLTSIIVDSNNEYYSSLDGVLFNKDITEIICFPHGKATTETQYTIPNSVTSIGYAAFRGCSGLSGELIIPNTVISIGNYAFYNCSGFSGELTIPESVISIGSAAFSGCTRVDNFIIENSTPCTLGSSVFPTNKFIYVPVGSIEEYNTASYWSSYTYLIEIDTDVELNITLTSPNSLLTEINSASSESSKINRLAITGELGDDDWALLKSDCTMLYYLDLSQATNSEIPSKTFSDNTLLQTVIMSNNLVSIGDSTFCNCSGLMGGLNIIPSTVKNIGNFAFFHCTGFSGELNVPESVTSIGDCAFAYCGGLTSIIADTNNKYYSSLDGVLFNKDATKIVAFPSGKSSLEPEYTIPNSVTTIGAGAFYCCSGFTGELTIPSTVTIIEDYAFYACTNLTGDLTIPNSVTSTGKGAFGWCLNITGELSISNSVTTIEDNTFAACGFTGELTIPETVTSIGKGAFSTCHGFTGNLIIPDSVTEIGSYAFQYCDGFSGVLTIPNSVISIGEGAFNWCRGFTGELTIPETVTYIGDYAFYNCSGLTGELNIPSSITSIGTYTFDGCNGFTGELTIPNSVTSIGDSAFRGCNGFTGELAIPNSVTYIGEGAFAFCSGFNDVKVNWETPLTVTSYYVFSTDTYSTATLSVPVGTLEAYKADSFWGDFYNIIEDSSLAVEDNLVNSAKVYTIDGALMVSGAVDGSAIKVYNLNGANVANGVVMDGTAQVELPADSGIYIVTVGNQSYKVVR